MKAFHRKVKKRLVKLGYPESDIQFSHGFRIWTRGDGIRYKDKDTVCVKNHSVKDVFKALDRNALHTISLSDEFTSSPWRPAVVHSGIIYILCADDRIEIATTAILKNVDIWKAIPRINGV